jgi:RES domain-containing protein
MSPYTKSQNALIDKPGKQPFMKTLWRISNYSDLSGKASRGASSRWHSPGRTIVYLAESAAGALLEHVAHFMDTDAGGALPRVYQLLQVSVSDECRMQSLNKLTQSDWQEHPEVTRAIGDAWLAAGDTPLARVPSAILPQTWNYLLNPDHPDAHQVQVAEVIKERIDSGLFRLSGR